MAGSSQIVLPPNIHSIDEPEHTKETMVYKTTANNLQLEIDIISPITENPTPVVISVHGGGLLNGTKEIFPFPWRKMVKCGITVASINYRLAPETKLDTMLGDIQDAIGWMLSQGPTVLNIDTSKVGLLGGSAGGFLSLLAGNELPSDIDVICCLWGYPDLGEWANAPSDHYLKFPLVNKANAWKNYTEAEKACRLKPKADEFNAGRFYLYARQQGLWAHFVTGIEEKSALSAYDKYDLSKNLNESFPPTIFVHGEKDVDVPFDNIAKFSSLIPESVLISSKNAGHGFQGADMKETMKMHEDVLVFLLTHFDKNQGH